MTESEAAEIVGALQQARICLSQNFAHVREQLMQKLLADETGERGVDAVELIEAADSEVRQMAGEIKHFRAYLKGWTEGKQRER
jgi:hypothetical protein